MAPEQAAGETTIVIRVTDVYGLGAVLYQLLTGHPPFAGGTSYETMRLVLDTEPRQPRLWNRQIEPELSTICLKCLEKDPKRRYASALALAEDLEHWLKHEPIRAHRTGIFGRGRKWVRRKPAIAALIAALVALAAAIGWIVWKNEPIHRPVTNGIAVLPFENLSGDPNNAYFADGMQEEILTRLASIGDLKVISRTSTQRYQSKPRNLSEIAKQLGVANIVEGSVQKAGDQVRVNVQLINAQTDSHLWAETYDRKLTDIFGVESEIAKGIAESLQIKLSGREGRALAVKPTNNPEAYDAYLRGLAFEARVTLSNDAAEKALDFYERAVQLDPNFAIAWARLSRALPLARAHRDSAKRALENAQKLQPNSTETLLALGYYQYLRLNDFGAAKTTFTRVRKMLPGSSDVPYALGRVARREGHWDEAVGYFEQALALDPRNTEVLLHMAWTYDMLRQFPAALKLYDRALDITPNDPIVLALKASIYQAQGNLQETPRLLSGINETSSAAAFEIKINQLRLERNYGEAIRLLQARLAQFRFDSAYDKLIEQVSLALIQCLAGDTVGAKVTAEPARKTLEQLYRDQSDNIAKPALIDPVYTAILLSQAYAVMGEKDLALRLTEQAIVLFPEAKDRVHAPSLKENLALIQTMLGENSHAISTLTQLLQTPYWSPIYYPAAITPALLRLDPIWDPLRADPAFQKLCEEKQPVASK
jgi:TolB-like protein/cytochrome c-type biogenesis protein CcmH/NrfG